MRRETPLSYRSRRESQRHSLNFPTADSSVCQVPLHGSADVHPEMTWEATMSWEGETNAIALMKNQEAQCPTDEPLPNDGLAYE